MRVGQPHVRAEAAMWVMYACLAGGGAHTAHGQAGGAAGDVHTYRDDGWIVKNAAPPRDDRIDLSAQGMEKAAFLLLEMGHEAHAARALATGARLADTSATCPAAFRGAQTWMVTSDASSRVRRQSCRTRPPASERVRRPLGPAAGVCA